MAGVKFTPSQQEAIEKKGTNIIVSAGAGSGKTKVLTTKVAYLIEEKNKLENQKLPEEEKKVEENK